MFSSYPCSRSYEWRLETWFFSRQAVVEVLLLLAAASQRLAARATGKLREEVSEVPEVRLRAQEITALSLPIAWVSYVYGDKLEKETDNFTAFCLANEKE